MLASAVALLFAALRMLLKRRGAMLARRQSPDYQRMRRRFRAINVVQWIAISASVRAARAPRARGVDRSRHHAHRGHALSAAGRPFRYRPHYLTGAVLIVTAALYRLASPGGPTAALGSLIAGITEVRVRWRHIRQAVP